ncbi:MAG: hypothetical protein LBD35_03935 [Prevotellaceae bacterium]|nr:hypothetical protein [Prevotellaceae bacterium]
MKTTIKKIGLIPLILLLFLSSCTDSELKKVEPLYDHVPDIARCIEGSLSAQEKQKIIKHINGLRAAHSLPALAFHDAEAARAQKIALFVAANGTVDAAPQSSDYCYKDEVSASWNSSSRTFLGSHHNNWTASDVHITGWMTDSANLSGRRRLLDPFLKDIAFGRVIGSPKKGDFKYVSTAAMTVGADAAPTDYKGGDFVAFPHGTCEAQYFSPDMILSFSVFNDKNSKANNRHVDFSETQIEITDGTREAEITDARYDYNPYGLPNNLQWKIAGIARNVTYNVKISKVRVAGQDKTYEYTIVIR